MLIVMVMVNAGVHTVIVKYPRTVHPVGHFRYVAFERNKK